VERLTVEELDKDFRHRGAFLLVDVKSRKLWFFHFSTDNRLIDHIKASLLGRREEMINFLIAQASAKGVRP
jgi:hypothetical protein